MTHEIHIGQPNTVCACCRRTFDNTVKPAGSMRITNPTLLVVNFFFEYRLCAECIREIKRGGEHAKQAAEKINGYHMGDDL